MLRTVLPTTSVLCCCVLSINDDDDDCVIDDCLDCLVNRGPELLGAPSPGQNNFTQEKNTPLRKNKKKTDK